MRGYYKGEPIDIHYTVPKNQGIMRYLHNDLRYISEEMFAQLLSGWSQYFGEIRDIWFGSFQKKDHPSQAHYRGFECSIRRFQRHYKLFGGSKKRMQDRCKAIKEELMMVVWHPDRVCKWMQAGLDVEDM